MALPRRRPASPISALTPEEKWAVIDGYGSINNAIDEALSRDAELRRLWDSQAAWWPDQRPFWGVFWARALPVLGLAEAAAEPVENDTSNIPRPPPPKPQESKRGRRKGDVSSLAAHRAAAIYAENPADYDARDDGGAYAVQKLYREALEPGSPVLLSRPMVGYLLNAIREGWLPWDAEKGALRISDEFRTSGGRFVIPRRNPAS